MGFSVVKPSGTMAARRAANRTVAALALAQQIDHQCQDSSEVQQLLTEIVDLLSLRYPQLNASGGHECKS